MAFNKERMGMLIKHLSDKKKMTAEPHLMTAASKKKGKKNARKY